MRATIDLNCDLGEGFGVWRLGDDEALLDVVTSANVACGFHAGDPSIMRSVCERAVSGGVAIGAQVGYRDLAGFGRRHIDIDPNTLADDVVYQLGALDGFARLAGDRVRYVKPHGALYNRIVTDAEQAAAVVAAVRDYDPALPVLGLPGSRFLALAADAGLVTVAEAFADRAYTGDGRLVPRGTPGAVIDDPGAIAERVRRLAVDGTIMSVDDVAVPVSARSVCVHGDTPHAVDIAHRVRSALDGAGIHVSAFAR
ncbi:MAG: LamB/YcsF family protein [Stackebrandtia sp.]